MVPRHAGVPPRHQTVLTHRPSPGAVSDVVPLTNGGATVDEGGSVTGHRQQTGAFGVRRHTALSAATVNKRFTDGRWESVTAEPTLHNRGGRHRDNGGHVTVNKR